MAMVSVPSISGEGNLTRYLQEIRKFPMLEPQERNLRFYRDEHMASVRILGATSHGDLKWETFFTMPSCSWLSR